MKYYIVSQDEIYVTHWLSIEPPEVG